MTHDVPRRLRLRAAAAVIVLAASFAALPATGAPDRPSESFHGADGIGGFLHRPSTADGPSAVVLIVHDSLGMDTRSHRYIAQLTAAGVAALEIELRANPPDGFPEPLPDTAEATGLVARAATALAADPRFDPARIGAIGFGLGARAVALTPSVGPGGVAFAARVLLYPGCASLRDRPAEGAPRRRDGRRPRPRDPRRGGRGQLARRLRGARRRPVRRRTGAADRLPRGRVRVGPAASGRQRTRRAALAGRSRHDRLPVLAGTRRFVRGAGHGLPVPRARGREPVQRPGRQPLRPRHGRGALRRRSEAMTRARRWSGGADDDGGRRDWDGRADPPHPMGARPSATSATAWSRCCCRSTSSRSASAPPRWARSRRSPCSAPP